MRFLWHPLKQKQDDTMTTPRLNLARKWLLPVGLLFCLATAQTALASISPAQRDQIKIGMTMAEVRQVLGEPAHSVRLRHTNGPTWKYDLDDGSMHKDYELDFSASGQVEWIELHDYDTN
jgi:hypothetical protein